MTQKIARYAVTNGLAGCYMPDYVTPTVAFHTRASLTDFIREEIKRQEFPKRMFDEVRIRRLWTFIQRHGSSTAHFSLIHKGYEISFSGLTEDEFNAADRDE